MAHRESEYTPPAIMAKDEGGFDPSKRKLCPDGTCLGLVGADGRCNVCGKTASGVTASAAAGDTPAGASASEYGDWSGGADDDAAGDAALSATAGAGADRSASDGSSPEFDPKRRLCDDGSCVGVVGPEGKCGVCGRVAGSSA
jgi:hypothetical protein